MADALKLTLLGSISLFWHFICLTKILSVGGGGVHMVFETARSVAVEYIFLCYSGVGISSCTANLYEL